MTWNPVHDSRDAFLSCMQALCTPGTSVALPVRPSVTSAGELDSAAAVLLALLDRGLALAVTGSRAAHEVGTLVTWHTGATSCDVEHADWVLVDGPPVDAISRARRGTPLTPESGATLVITATGGALPVDLTGPGIAGTRTTDLALDTMAVHALSAANAAPPCGIDVLIVDAGQVVALPRSVALTAGAA